MLVAVLSIKGSPGVTTFSVALAARWPAPARALLIEADPSGGDIGTRFSLQTTPGLVSLAAAVRHSNDPALLWQHAQALPGGLPVVSAPPDAELAWATLTALADATVGAGPLKAAADAPNGVVIMDCGRMDVGSPVLPLVRSADAMVLLTRAQADDLAHLARRLAAIGSWTARPAMVLVGDGYTPAEVARVLGVLPLGRIPDDPHGAAVLCGRPSTVRRNRSGPAHSALGQAASKVATVLSHQPQPPAVLRLTAAGLVIPTQIGAPASLVSTNGPRLAPVSLPPHQNTPRGGQAS